MPQNWLNIYPQGTTEGDEEQKIFIAFRNPKWTWLTVAALAKTTSLTPKRIEEILNKYHRLGMVFQDPDNAKQWCYWERVPELVPKNKDDIATIDQQKRIKNQLDK